MEIPELLIDELAEIDDLIPQKCKECGVQCELAKKIAGLIFQKVITSLDVENLIFSDNPEVDEILEMITSEEDITVDNVKALFARSAAADLNEIDDDIASIKEKLFANTQSCDGVLKMRAQHKDSGITYTASVCTSANVYTPNSPMHVSTHITAS